jgi:alpha-glucosidase
MIESTSSIFDRLKIDGQPVANSRAVVICNQARFTVLTSRLIRLEWSPTGQFEDRATYAFPNRWAKTPRFVQDRCRDLLTLKTDDLFLSYKDDGQPFHPANLSITFQLNGQSRIWQPRMKNTGNLRGTRRTLDLCTGGTTLQEGLLSRDGWTLVDDSGTPLWNRDQSWVEARPDGHLYDWYFFGYGHDYKATLHDYLQFGGAIPLIPRYVLGAWWSRYWAYHVDDLKQLVNDFNMYEVPLDVLVVDMDWHSPEGWTGYTWNRDLFPDPEGFLAWVHAQDLGVTLNLHPAQGVQAHEEAYPKFAELMGHDAALGEAISFRPTDKTFIQLYFELLHHPLENQGVDFWWLDWQQGESTDVKNLDPLTWLNHLHFQDSSRRGTRPMLYSRWGGLGNHRYPIGFSGDTFSTWESLHFQPYFTATAANVCYGWWSHDIGGHLGPTDPELYARWVQFGAVSPCLRLHSSKNPLDERRPWAFPEPVFQAAKAAIEFRYQLLPYLYSAAHHASVQGLALCTPLYYDYPENEDAYHAHGQYFLGADLIAAPIVRPADPETGLAPIEVWIPEGDWIEYTTLEVFHGPAWVRRFGDLNRIPVFARAGAILPFAPATLRTRRFDGSHIDLVIFPYADGQFELYEDDGLTEGYENAASETTLIRSVIRDAHTFAISIAGSEGNCDSLPARRSFSLHLKKIPSAQSITLNQRELSDWHFDAARNELVIALPELGRHIPLEIVVQTVEDVQNPILAKQKQPFIHFIDYEIFDDARNQLGTIVIVPTGSPCDAEIEWTLECDGVTQSSGITLENCRTRQIVQCPFQDSGNLATFRWQVSVRLVWRGQTLHETYRSKDAYPGINHWSVFTAERQSTKIGDVLTSDGRCNPALAWRPVAQTVEQMRNIKQPFGLVLSETVDARTAATHEAYLRTTLVSPSAQALTLYMESIDGEHRCFLNGVEVFPVPAVQHAHVHPMLYLPAAPTQTYYTLPLAAGINELLVMTRPDANLRWWGVGATVFEASGDVYTAMNAAHA